MKYFLPLYGICRIFIYCCNEPNHTNLLISKINQSLITGYKTYLRQSLASEAEWTLVNSSLMWSPIFNRHRLVCSR